MALDPSIPLQVNTQPINPLMQVAQVAQVGDALLRQDALRQQINANVAASQAFKDSTDPNTGTVDYAKLQANLAQGPGAYNLPTIMGQALDQQKKQFDFSAAKLDAVRQTYGGLLLDKDVNPAKVYDAIGGLVQSGVVPMDMARARLATMPTDPQGLRSWLLTQAGAADKASQMIANIKPGTQVINNGAGNTIFALDPMTGQPIGSTFVPSTLTPAEAAARVPTFQNGQPGSVPMGSLVPGTPGYGGGAGSPGAGGIPGMGGAGAAPGGFLPTGPKLGQEAASAETGQLDAKAADAAYTEAQGAPTRILQLQTGLQALQNITTGPNQDRWNQFKTIVGNMPGIGGMVDMNKVRDFDEFHKVMTAYATNQMASMGNGSDSKLAAAISGNPNDKISNLANDQILRMTIGLEGYKAAMTQAFQQSGATPGSFRDFQTRWNAQVDPRAFVASQMSDADLQRMYSRMSPAEQSKFNATWALAEKNGWLTPQTQMGAH